MKIQAQIEKVNTSYKAQVNKYQKPMVFNLGDIIWLHPMKDRFYSRRQNKLMVHREDPFKVLEWMGTIPTSWT